MSTSLLYHGFGLRGCRYVRTEQRFGETHFTVELQRLACPACGADDVIRRGVCPRRFRGLPIGGRPTWIHADIQRVECRRCHAVQRVEVPFARPRCQTTKAFERYALELCGCMTIQDVADHLGVSWDLVKGIHKRYLQKRFAKPRLADLTYIAIDEVCIGRPRKFLTVVLDLMTGAVVFVGDGKGREALKGFWKRLKASRAYILAVATDMSPAYVGAVMENLPDADLVLDRFHIVKWFNEKITTLRRQVQRAAKGLAKDVLKGIRWLLLKNPENLQEHDDPAKDERKRLQEALAINEPLMQAYYLKDDLRQFWRQKNRTAAERFLDGWLQRAEATGLTVLKKVARRLHLFRFGLLNWYDHQISTGPLEATNNKIGTLQRRAYGYRDREYFILQIYSAHEKKYALVG
jgi:transposase